MKRDLRLVCCGGRDYNDRAAVYRVLDWLHDRRHLVEVIEGGQRGADSLAGDWADAHGVTRTTVSAKWGQMGRSAGPERNRRMCFLAPDGVVAFPSDGPGTRSMINMANSYGISVWEPLKPAPAGELPFPRFARG